MQRQCSVLVLKVQFGHRLQELLLSFLRSQLQHFLWVAGVELRLSDRFYLNGLETSELKRGSKFSLW